MSSISPLDSQQQNYIVQRFKEDDCWKRATGSKKGFMAEKNEKYSGAKTKYELTKKNFIEAAHLFSKFEYWVAALFKFSRPDDLVSLINEGVPADWFASISIVAIGCSLKANSRKRNGTRSAVFSK
ncbi:hypothetical protein [Coleofasciculus sp. F4-SAH-05]|uniref:hypothetical protein n=1 Tax=Coleofasciculus sp. F4-SAH-05 TaxID=3069525 RepID=UPI0032F65FA4